MLFILSQVMGKDAKAGMMATVGVCLGYLVHSVWIAYLLFLAFSLIKSVFNTQKLAIEKKNTANPIQKGFFTALLNPKGMLIYFAILPQFIDKTGHTVSQGLILSFIFIGLCFVVYCSLSVIFARISQNTQIDERKQKWIDGGSGGLLMLAATWLIIQ